MCFPVINEGFAVNARCYLRTEKDKEILRWVLELAPNTCGQNATIVNYAFTLKYDNDMAIQTVN